MRPKLEYFILCEDAHQRADGKVDVAGFVMGPVMTDGAGHLPQLSCLLVLSGMRDVSRYKPTIVIQPPGEKFYEREQDWIERPAENEYQVYKVTIGEFPVREGRTVVSVAFDFGGGISGRYSAFFDVVFAKPPDAVAG